MSVSDFLADANAQLDRLRNVVTQLGLKYVELNPVATGVGFAVPFGESDYVVVAVAGGGSEGTAYITSGVFRDINQDERGVPHEVERARPDFATMGIYGTPYRLAEQDARRLLTRSLGSWIKKQTPTSTREAQQDG